MTDSLVSAVDLSKTFTVRDRGNRKRTVDAVRSVSLDISRGETVALVGESGSGKSTLGRMILQLETPTSGSVVYDGTDVTALSRAERRPFHRSMQVVYQDPYSSLSPGRTALQQVLEPLHAVTDDPDPVATATRALEQVGITGDQVHRLPRAFSGGQRQRIAIARAIAVRPAFVLCDEPVSALDVSIRAQVVGLLQDLQRELGLTYLFISHDLSVVREIAQRTAVMFRGRLMEVGPTEQVFSDPQHPYTRMLLDAVLPADPTAARERLQRSVQTVWRPDAGDEDSALVEAAPGHFVRR